MDAYDFDDGWGGILAAQGRYVATNGCVDSGCDIYLADFGASALYRVRSPHSGHGAEVMGLSDGELFVADYSETVRGSSDFDALVRYDLAELDHFATRL